MSEYCAELARLYEYDDGSGDGGTYFIIAPSSAYVNVRCDSETWRIMTAVGRVGVLNRAERREAVTEILEHYRLGVWLIKEILATTDLHDEYYVREADGAYLMRVHALDIELAHRQWATRPSLISCLATLSITNRPGQYDSDASRPADFLNRYGLND